MELTNVEMAVVEVAVDKASEARMHELKDLQLAFIGGGVGEITPY